MKNLKKLIVVLLFCASQLYAQTSLMNTNVVSYIKINGKSLAPNYDKVPCTDFLIKVLSNYYKLSTKDIQQISISITTKDDINNFSIYLNNINSTSNFYEGKAYFGHFPHKIYCVACSISDMESYYTNLSKGVVQWVVDSKKGIEIEVKYGGIPEEGDFVQFWKINGFGHCGILKSVDLVNKKITLYSSFPSTHGYGIQEFDLSKFTYFARLK